MGPHTLPWRTGRRPEGASRRRREAATTDFLSFGSPWRGCHSTLSTTRRGPRGSGGVNDQVRFTSRCAVRGVVPRDGVPPDTDGILVGTCPNPHLQCCCYSRQQQRRHCRNCSCIRRVRQCHNCHPPQVTRLDTRDTIHERRGIHISKMFHTPRTMPIATFHTVMRNMFHHFHATANTIQDRLPIRVMGMSDRLVVGGGVLAVVVPHAATWGTTSVSRCYATPGRLPEWRRGARLPVVCDRENQIL